VFAQCESYMRLVREALAHEEGVVRGDLDVESLIDVEDDDKTYAAMGVAKTIGTVRILIIMPQYTNTALQYPNRLFPR
jgi:hypothetical protein